jgi:hypothetical protein
MVPAIKFGLDKLFVYLGWGDLKGKRQLERSRCRWEDNIKNYLQEMGWGHKGLTWLILGQLRRLENTAFSLLVPLNVGKFLNSSEAVSDSRRALLYRFGLCVYTVHISNISFSIMEYSGVFKFVTFVFWQKNKSIYLVWWLRWYSFWYTTTHAIHKTGK